MKAFFTMILTAFFITFSQAQNTDLSLNLQKGKEYKQVTNSKSSIVQSVSGQEMKMDMTISGVMSFLVKSITNDGYILEAKYQKLGMSMESMQGKMEFDSENSDSNNILSKVLRAIKSSPFEVSLSKKGKVTQIKGIENLWKKAINELGELPEAQKEQIKTQIMKAYGNEALKGNMEMVTAIYPENPVKKGDTWKATTTLQSGMSAKVNTVYEYAGTTDNYALIKGKSTIETDKDTTVNMGPIPMKYDLKGTMVSEIKVDKNTGWVIESDINQNFKGNTFIEKTPQMPQGMTIPMEINTKVRITD